MLHFERWKIIAIVANKKMVIGTCSSIFISAPLIDYLGIKRD